MTRKQSLLFLGKLAFSGVLLWFVLARVDLAGITVRLRAADLQWLIPTLLIGPAVVALSAWRWHKLSLGLIGFGAAVRYTWIGLFFGTIMPGFVAGDVAKGVSLAARESRMRDALLPVSIVVDKLIGFWALMMLFCIVAIALLITQPQLLTGTRGAVMAAAFFVGVGLLCGAVVCHPRGAVAVSSLGRRLPFAPLRNIAGRLLAAIGTYVGQDRVLIQAVAVSVLLHALNAIALWFVMRSLAIPATLGFAAVFYPMLSFLLALPVSISGVGVRDVFAAGMFTAFGLNPESGVAFSWLLLGLSIPNALVGGAIQLWEMFRRRGTD